MIAEYYNNLTFFLSVSGAHAINTKSNQIAKICFIFCDNMTWIWWMPWQELAMNQMEWRWSRKGTRKGFRKGSRKGREGYWQRKPNANLGALFTRPAFGGWLWVGSWPGMGAQHGKNVQIWPNERVMNPQLCCSPGASGSESGLQLECPPALPRLLIRPVVPGHHIHILCAALVLPGQGLK